MRLALFVASWSALTLAAGVATADARSNPMPGCLAKAGVTGQQWQNRQASYAQGAVVRECMAKAGQPIVVHKHDGSVLH